MQAGLSRAAQAMERHAAARRPAEMQGFGVIAGSDLECVLTLGTGMGSALYRDGALLPHLERKKARASGTTACAA